MESKFLVSEETKPDNKRSITHYQYIHWPDFGNPNTKTLVELARRVGPTKPDKPMVLHCSAGLGRSGVFATVHSCLECHVDKRHVDPHRTVASFRRQREGMVQTQEQYRFCYDAIAEALLPAEMDKELTQQGDFRPTSYPPPPYKEKEESQQEPTQVSCDRETTPSPPPLSEPSTPVKVAIPETPPSITPPKQQPSTDTLEKKRLSQASVATTPSRPVSGEGEEVRRKLASNVSSARVEVVVEVEPSTKSQAQPTTNKGERGEHKKAEPTVKKVEQSKTKVTSGEDTKQANAKLPEVRTSRDESPNGMSVPTVLVTAPSTEQLNITDEEGEEPPPVPTSPPPTEEEEPPPFPTSPPPDDFPSASGSTKVLRDEFSRKERPAEDSPEPDREEKEAEEVGFAIGEDQVIVEKPYKKVDKKAVSKGLPSNMPKWKHQPSTKTPSSSSTQLPKWKLEQQRRAEEAKRKALPTKVAVPQLSSPVASSQRGSVPGKVIMPDMETSPEQTSPKRVGKLIIPSLFRDARSGSEIKPFTSKTSPQTRSHDVAAQKVGHVQLTKSSGSQPTPPSSPTPPTRKKWTVKSETPSPQKEDEKETGNTPPALKKLKQLQRRGNQASLSSSPIYKLPAMAHSSKTTPSQSEATPALGSSSGTHSADTETGNVARLLAKFQ